MGEGGMGEMSTVRDHRSFDSLDHFLDRVVSDNRSSKKQEMLSCERTRPTREPRVKSRGSR